MMKSPVYSPNLTTQSKPQNYNINKPNVSCLQESYMPNSPTFDGISFAKGNLTGYSFEEDEDDK